MRRSCVRCLLTLMLLSAVVPLWDSVSHAQGPVLHQPLTGTLLITSYVDHDFPNYIRNNYMLPYYGEQCLDCANDYTIYTDPYCYDSHPGIDYNACCELGS